MPRHQLPMWVRAMTWLNTKRPVALDLFCGAGGMARGLQAAGFHVVGIDINPQPNYAGDEFYQLDALEALQNGEFEPFDMVHASCPCQAHSDLQKQSKIIYRDFIPETRMLLKRTGRPYIIENVEGAPLIDPIMLCGTMFPPLRVIRHRLFESNIPLTAPLHGKHPLVFTHDKRKGHYDKLNQDTAFVQVTGGGNCTVKNKQDAMGIDWMTGKELNEAIPPAYAEWIGRQVLQHLTCRQEHARMSA